MIVHKKLKVIYFLFLWSFIFAQSDFRDDSPDRNAKKTANPHAGEAECSLCHQGLYEKKENIDQNLCFRCHKMEKYKDKRYKHNFEVGCLSCHQNHQPKGEPLLKNNPIDLCIACHDVVVSKRTHPMRVRDPNTAGELTCTSSCHDVHGTDFKFLCKLEPGRQLCISCHQDLR